MTRAVIEGIVEGMAAPADVPMHSDIFFLGIDPHKCNGCNSCMEQCPTGAIYGETGMAHQIAYPEPCLHCGLCLMHCPSSAIYEEFSWLNEVKKKIADPKTIVVAMPAPSLRYSFAEAFGIEGAPAPKMLSVIRELGFDHCWDIEFAADVEIWESGTEFAQRLNRGGPLPFFTSCCSSWQKYAETFYPDLLEHFSEVKSPTAINGRLAKTYAAEQYGLNPQNIYTVAITPCVAKKYEILRPELSFNNLRDIDANLTTREFIHMIREANIDCSKLPDGQPDSILGESSGGGTLFGVSGGVAEALLRFAWQAMTGKTPENWDFAHIRGHGGIREGQVQIGERRIRVAAVQGAKYFERICEAVRAGNSPYDLIEFMACPGGCVCGGGQPLPPDRR